MREEWKGKSERMGRREGGLREEEMEKGRQGKGKEGREGKNDKGKEENEGRKDKCVGGREGEGKKGGVEETSLRRLLTTPSTGERVSSSPLGITLPPSTPPCLPPSSPASP